MNFTQSVYLTPTQSSPETEQAQRILNFIERRLVPLLNQQQIRIYLRCRSVLGAAATTNQGRLFGHGVKVAMPRMNVSGSGDEAYGHNRVTALFNELLLPMIERGELSRENIRELQSLCRGFFSQQFKAIEKAAAQQECSHCF